MATAYLVDRSGLVKLTVPWVLSHDQIEEIK